MIHVAGQEPGHGERRNGKDDDEPHDSPQFPRSRGIEPSNDEHGANSEAARPADPHTWKMGG
jgi:hypothetical protein